MTFRDWLKHQVTHHDNHAATKREGGYAYGYHSGAADHFTEVDRMLRKDKQ